jgi:DNA polymerase V
LPKVPPVGASSASAGEQPAKDKASEAIIVYFAYLCSVMKEGRTVTVYGVEDPGGSYEVPYVGKIKAGFASPAQDYPGETIDLNKLIIRNSDYTFIGKIEGTSMIDDALNDGDLVIIDRSLEPRDKDSVLVYIDGEYTIKHVTVDKENQTVWLIPANEDFPRLQVTPDSEFIIWGVVTYTITKHR